MSKLPTRADASSETAKRLIKIYGERHTGTNVAERLIGKWPGVQFLEKGHYLPAAKKKTREIAAILEGRLPRRSLVYIRECLQDEWTLADGPLGAWKHAAAVFSHESISAGARVLFLVKSPGAWIVSFYRKPYHRLTKATRLETLADFLRTPWITVQRELVPQVVLSPLTLWNIKVRSYLSFQATAEPLGVKCKFVRAEDLVLRQKDELRDIATWLGASPGKIKTRDTSVRGPQRTLETLKTYYGNELWRSEISPEVRELAVGLIEPDLLERFDYKL